MRYLTVPEPIICVDFEGHPLRDSRTGQYLTPSTFTDFLMGRALDPIFLRSGLEGIEASLAIRAAVKGKGAGDMLEIEESHWRLLVQATEQPLFPYDQAYSPIVAVQLLPFMKHVKTATDAKPAVVR